MVLDWWLGKEGIQYFSERDLCIVTRKYVEEDETEIDHLKGVGALNLLALDDLRVSEEGGVYPRYYFHRPVIVRNSKTLIGQVRSRLKVYRERADDDVSDRESDTGMGRREAFNHWYRYLGLASAGHRHPLPRRCSKEHVNGG